MIPDITNPHYEQTANLLHDDAFTLAGFTMCGRGMGKAVRERFVALAAGLMRKHGPRAFEMPKRAAAIHEAGHTVANAALGVRTTSVLIDPINRGGKFFWIGYTDAPELAFLDTPSALVSFDRLLNRSRIVYAGLAAELLFAGDDKREGSSIDELMMSQILAEQAASLVGACAERLWREDVAAWCNIQLYRNRDAHAQIAAALLKRGRLKGKVLRELCAKVLPSTLNEDWPDIHDHAAQFEDAGILPDLEDYA